MIKFLKHFFFPSLFSGIESTRLWVKVQKFCKSRKEKENIIMKVIENLEREMIIEK